MSPPASIKAAVFLAGVSFYFGVLLIQLDPTIKSPTRELVVISLGAAIFWLLRSLYWGRNWARVLLFVLYALSFLGLNAVLRKVGFDFWRSMTQMILQLLVIGILVSKASREWFKKAA